MIVTCKHRVALFNAAAGENFHHRGSMSVIEVADPADSAHLGVNDF